MPRTFFSSDNGVFGQACLCLLLSLLLFTSILARDATAQQQIPETIAYQGYLTDTDGDPLSGTALVLFSLYDQRAGGTALWQEVQRDVLFTDGVFSAHLGSVESLAGVPFEGPLWLGVSIGGGAELAPRVALEAVPYALSVRGLRVVPGTSQNPSPNLIGGYFENSVDEDINGATIGGGGGHEDGNIVRGDYGTISGGLANRAGLRASVGGGQANRAEAMAATIGGGANNRAGENATVGGGTDNTASGQSATIAGGLSNVASGAGAVVGGGGGHRAEATAATISGGQENRADGMWATVPGGLSNRAEGRASLAAGYNAHAAHYGAFVWADYLSPNEPPFASTAERQFLIRARGGVGIGTNAPKSALHLTELPLNLSDAALSDEALIVEGDKPVIGVYANFRSNTRPGLVLAGVNENGNVVDKWSIVREFFGINRLHFTYGIDEDHTQNTTVLSLSRDEGAAAEQFTATDDLGSTGTPAPGGHYRDNVVYAWAQVNADGTVAASFGCDVTRIGPGRYSIDYNRDLPNGMAPAVTPLSANDPVIATAAPSGSDGATVVTFAFVGGLFQADDRPFFIQVVGRP